MSKSLSLRALVSERLTAAAEEIFILVERTIAEYEEELSRAKEESQRKQEILEELLKTPGRTDIQVPPLSEASISALDSDDPLCSFLPDFNVKAENNKDPTTRVKLPRTETTEEEPELKRFKLEPVDHIELSSDSDGDSETPGQSSLQHKESEAERDTDHTGPSEAERYDHDNTDSNSLETRQEEGFSNTDINKTQSHECLACGETFSDDTELREHMSSHVGGKPFSCPVCGKLFTRKNDYSLHLTVHTGDAPFRCPECPDARFALQSHLESHLKGHRAPPVRCPVCHKSFTRKYRLHSHMASHTGERPYSCPVCARAFTRKDNLSTHMAMHNGKPFACAVCNHCFIRKDRLMAHMASHTLEKL